MGENRRDSPEAVKKFKTGRDREDEAPAEPSP